MSCADGLYSGFRKNCGPTLYASNKTPVTTDVLEVGLLYAAAILAISFIVVVPGYKGKQILFVTIRVFISLFVLTSILLCNFGQEWEVSELSTRTPYRAGLAEEIHAHIGVKIGLRSINITLRGNNEVGDPEIYKFKNGTHEERINYNERFHWDSLGFAQGRAGFGPQAGLFNREFRAAQNRGSPIPILWIAEYFTLDGEGIRWGRHFRQAGWYAHISMWAAFPLWILTLCTVYMVLFYACMCSLLTGAFLIIANIEWAAIRNRNELSGAIPFEDGRLNFTFGWCFWLNLITGFICIILGIVTLILDYCFEDKITTFFGVNVLSDYEEVHIYTDHTTLVEDANGYSSTVQIKRQMGDKTGKPFTEKQAKAKNRLTSLAPMFARKSDSNSTVISLDTVRNGSSGSAEPASPTFSDVYEDVEQPTSPSAAPPVVQRQYRRRRDTNANLFASRNKKTMPRPQRQTPPSIEEVDAPGPSASNAMPRLPDKKKSPGVTVKPQPNPQPPQWPQNSEEPMSQARLKPSGAQGPKPSPKPSRKPGTATAKPKDSPPTKPKPKVPASPGKIRDDSGRTDKPPEDVFSGEYDNNYENAEEIQAMADKGESGARL